MSFLAGIFVTQQIASEQVRAIKKRFRMNLIRVELLSTDYL